MINVHIFVLVIYLYYNLYLFSRQNKRKKGIGFQLKPVPFDLLESLRGYHHSSFGYLSPHSFLSFVISFAIMPQPITPSLVLPFPCVKLLSERLKYLITFFDISRAISVQQVTEIVYLQKQFPSFVGI